MKHRKTYLVAILLFFTNVLAFAEEKTAYETGIEAGKTLVYFFLVFFSLYFLLKLMKRIKK